MREIWMCEDVSLFVVFVYAVGLGIMVCVCMCAGL